MRAEPLPPKEPQKQIVVKEIVLGVSLGDYEPEYIVGIQADYFMITKLRETEAEIIFYNNKTIDNPNYAKEYKKYEKSCDKYERDLITWKLQQQKKRKKLFKKE